MRPLRDRIAEAIRDDGSVEASRTAWNDLSASRKGAWLGDADRVITAMSRELADVLRVVYAAQSFVDNCPSDDAGSPYMVEGACDGEFDTLVAAAGNLGERATAELLSTLKAASTDWRCPINNPDCRANCGNYGCGN